MRLRFLHIFFLSAWLVATGGLWDLVQVGAWANMFSNNLTTMTVGEAARQTFLPEGKCRLCLAVEDGKREQDDSPGLASSELSKTVIVFQSQGRVTVVPPDGVTTMRIEADYASYRREVPPLPPPRA